MLCHVKVEAKFSELLGGASYLFLMEWCNDVYEPLWSSLCGFGVAYKAYAAGGMFTLRQSKSIARLFLAID